MSIFKQGARASVSLLALAAITPAFAQSTGSQVFDQSAIVVTGAKGPKAVDGVSIPDSTKTRQVLTQAVITHQTPGQSIDDIINLMPGVSFQNNDGYGASGGFLTIRGFDASRISQTFDGIPLNDTGNYAIYSNQQLDPELIDQVNVSLGSSDIDSPTPSATGSTVNYVSRTPTDNFHVRLQGTIGQYNMMRIFGVVDTGVFTPFGTKAWLSASEENYNSPFNNIGKLRKDQANFKVYQPLGDSGNFISVAGNYNDNRNNFSASAPLRNDTTILSAAGVVTGARTVGTATSNRFPDSSSDEFYTVPACTTTAAGPGAQTANSCGTAYDYRYNPSRTGNIRVNSRFGITDKLILTVDPFYEYTDANGGGTVTANEKAYTKTVNGQTFTGYGYIGGQFYVGHDLNGDGDTLDTVSLLAPSNTITNRYGVIANLIYDLTPSQTFRLNYTLDYGHHRQTGEAGYLTFSGQPTNVFPQGDPILDGNGNVLEKRDRLSLAILNQVAGQYRGKFFDDKLTVEAGARAAFFQRKLHNFCYSTNGSGNVDCLDENSAAATSYLGVNPYSVSATAGLPSGSSPVTKRDFHFNKVLPSGGLTYDLGHNISVYGSYSKGLQVPGTDQLYNGFYYPSGTQPANPKPETSDNFDTGIRMRSGKVQAQFAAWYTVFKNRIEQTYDPIAQLSTYTNLGTVHKYGFDGSLAYNVIPQLSLYVFGSYLHSKILDNVQIGTCGPSGLNTSIGPNVTSCVPNSAIFAATAGKRESNAPVYTFGGRAEGHVGPAELGVQIKRTGPRYINDQNTPVYQSYVAGGATHFYQVYGAKTPSYLLVDLDARFSLKALGMNDATWLQFNVTNLTNKFYVGASSTGNATPLNTAVNFVQIGAPRTISGTVNFGF
ncbi:TonB-dependent receptor [uncultured Sphingomonas sp.]|uniref:TonB-dependent receptor n=1 Tax=uncultured Sphingomonas sp. TaxID=158754 RepID=UPI003427B50C